MISWCIWSSSLVRPSSGWHLVPWASLVALMGAVIWVENRNREKPREVESACWVRPQKVRRRPQKLTRRPQKAPRRPHRKSRANREKPRVVNHDQLAIGIHPHPAKSCLIDRSFSGPEPQKVITCFRLFSHCRGYPRVYLVGSWVQAIPRTSKVRVLESQGFWRSNLISCENVAAEDVKLQFYRSFWRSNLISCERVAAEDVESQFLPQFWTIEPHFVRKVCISWRLVGTAPRLKREIEKKEKEEGKRARGKEGKREKMWRCEDEKMWRWEGVKMRGCEDEKMWRCLKM